MGYKASTKVTLSLSRVLRLKQAIREFQAACFRSRNYNRNAYDLPVVIHRLKSPSEAAL